MAVTNRKSRILGIQSNLLGGWDYIGKNNRKNTEIHGVTQKRPLKRTVGEITRLRWKMLLRWVSIWGWNFDGDHPQIEMGISNNGGTPKWRVYKIKSYYKMDDLGVPLFQESSKCLKTVIFKPSPICPQTFFVLKTRWNPLPKFRSSTGDDETGAPQTAGDTSESPLWGGPNSGSRRSANGGTLLKVKVFDDPIPLSTKHPKFCMVPMECGNSRQKISMLSFRGCQKMSKNV